jgi:hypothetical protein
MDPISFLIGVVVGVAIGAWGYRYALKRDPDALEDLAKEIRRRSP